MIANEILAVRPDWSDTLRMEYAWKTTIKRGLAGHEKRSGLLSAPRRAFEFTVQARTGLESEMLKKRLYTAHGKIFGVPLWTDATALAVGVSAGATSLPVLETGFRLFQADSLAIIVSGGSYEVVEVSGVSTSVLSLAEAVTQDWPAGSFVAPFFQGRVDDSKTTVTGKTDRDGTVSLRLLEEFDERFSVPTPDMTDYPTYNGLPVLNTPHNWSDRYSQTMEMDTEAFSFSSLAGLTERVLTQDEPRLTISLSANAFTREESRRLLDFFIDRKGRLLPFWVPSPASDVILAGAFSSGDTILDTGGVDMSALFGQGYPTTGKHLWFRFPDGTTAAREVVGCDPSTGRISLGSAIGKTVEHFTDVTVSLLYPARFDKDTLGMDYETLDVASTTLHATTLPRWEVE